MAGFWNARAPRERLLLACGALVVVAVLIWAGLWLPLQEQEAALEARIDSQSRTLERLAEARTLRTSARQTQSTSPRRPLTGSSASRADRGLRLAGMAAAIRRIEPGSDGSVNISLERASFDDLVDWLARAPAEQGLVPQELDADATDTPGAVNVRLRLMDTNDG